MNPNRQQERILRIPGGDNRRRDSSTTVSGTTSTQSLSQRFRAHINSRYSTKVENADTAHAVDRTLFVNSNQEMVPTRSDQSYNAEIMPQVQDIAQKQSQYPQLRSPANRDLTPAQQSTSYKQIDNNQGVASTRDMQQFRPVLMADPVRSTDSKPLEVNSSSSKTWNPFRNMRYDSTQHNTREFSGVEDIFRLYGNQIPRTGQPQSLPGPTNSNLEQVSQIQTGQSHIQQTTSRHHQQNHNPFTSYHQSSMGNPPLLQTSRSPSILENRQGTPRVESPILREQNPDLNNMDDYKGSQTNPNNQRTSQQMISEPYGQQLGSSQPNTEALSRYQDIANSYPVVTRQTLDIQHGVQSGSNQRHQEVSPTYVSAAPATETNRHTVRGAFQTQSRPAYTQQIRNTFRNEDLNTPLQTSRNQNGNQHRSMGISQVRSPSHNHTYSQQVRIIPSRQEYNPPMDTVSSTQEGISMPSMPDIQSYRHQVRSMGNYYRLPGMDHGVDSSRNPSRDVNLEAPAEYKQQVRLHSSRHDVIPQAQLSGAYMQEIRGASPRNSGNLFISSGQPRALHVNGHYSGNPETQSNPRGSSGSFQSETIVTNTPYNRYYPPNQFSNRESIPTINTENNPANAHTMVASLYNSRGRSSNYTDNIATENTASTQFNNEHNLQAVGRHNGLQSPSAPGRPVLQPSQWDTNGSSLETVHVPVSNQNSPPPNNLPNSAHELPGTTSVSQNISLLELISRIVEATLEPTTSSPVRSALEPNLPHIQNPNTTLDSQAFETFPNDMWNHRGQPSRQFLKFITSHPDYNSLISDVANAASDSSIQHSQPVLNDTNLANTNILGPSAAGQFSDPSLSIQRSVLRDSPDSHGSVPHSNLTQNTASDQSVNLTEVRVNMLKNIRRALAVTTGSRHPLSAMPVLQNRTADDLVVMAVDSIMRMEALRSLDCRSISYMYNVNFMDYMPIACDNSCPPISKCVNVGSIGFCCPLYGNYVSV
ncbi:hypothetical protein SNE40_016654 [Patella caerulea]|uniref:Uncharacterized protein n=1 Tax=Patella caerulea TaxID=87958 RepID=A0AAN8PJT4_PATCE